MSRSRHAYSAVALSLIISLGGCNLLPNKSDEQANFFVAEKSSTSEYMPQGYGWVANSNIAIDVFDEPDSNGNGSNQWKHVLDMKTDGSGLFGFEANPKTYQVRRSICGSGENGQTLTFRATNQGTGKIAMARPLADLYFTFKPCP